MKGTRVVGGFLAGKKSFKLRIVKFHEALSIHVRNFNRLLCELSVNALSLGSSWKPLSVDSRFIGLFQDPVIGF